MYETTDVNCTIELLTKCIKSTLKLFLPKKSCHSSRYPCRFSDELKCVLRKKNCSIIKNTSLRERNLVELFSESRASAKLLIKRNKKSYHESVECRLKRDLKFFWRYVTGRMTMSSSAINLRDTWDKVLSEPACVSNAFTNYIQSVLSLNPAVICAPVDRHFSNDNHSIASFQSAKTELAIGKLKTKLSISFNKIPSFIVKGCSSIFAPILTHILNLSLSSSTFPKLGKNSVIVVKIATYDQTRVLQTHKAGISACMKSPRLIVCHNLFTHKISITQHAFFAGTSVETNLVLFEFCVARCK